MDSARGQCQSRAGAGQARRQTASNLDKRVSCWESEDGDVHRRQSGGKKGGWGGVKSAARARPNPILTPPPTAQPLRPRAPLQPLPQRPCAGRDPARGSLGGVVAAVVAAAGGGGHQREEEAQRGASRTPILPRLLARPSPAQPRRRRYKGTYVRCTCSAMFTKHHFVPLPRRIGAQGDPNQRLTF